ncbi:MAG: hypothetical protein EGR02_00250 [Clostridiales bacterium]|nr:hypothetical protein [Clostridiales bacterium]
MPLAPPVFSSFSLASFASFASFVSPVPLAVRIDAHTVQEIQQGGVGGDGKEGVLVRDGEVGGEGSEGVAVVAEEGEGMIFFLAALTEIRAG